MKLLKLIFKIGFWFVGISILGYILLISFLIFGPRIKSYADRKSFDLIQWKAHLEDREPIKLHMVDDLLSRHQLIGMNVKAIEELLGKPPRTNYFKDYDYVYWLGPERNLLGVDSEWLGIKFQDGIAIKADLLRD